MLSHPKRLLPLLLAITLAHLAPADDTAERIPAPSFDFVESNEDSTVAPAYDISELRLVPFPICIDPEEGSFSFEQPLTLEVSKHVPEPLINLIVEELQRAGYAKPKVLRGEEAGYVLRLASESSLIPLSHYVAKTEGPVELLTPGTYVLLVEPDQIIASTYTPAGLCYSVQTLCQLIRANRHDHRLRCLTILDTPMLRWRCFQDDLTRGPSSTLDTLKEHVELGSFFKMNLFTYYMEYQYAFKKHPEIGPPDGSLEPEDLSALVDHAKLRNVDILGNQQSFGHATHILKHDRYAPLRETNYILCPTNEATYELLDDLYSEVCPRLPFEMFNVCCDETWGLGTGPSKTLADEIGVGGVYVRHIRRVHDLLRDKYQKRMMMWGDIILKHPDKLDQIPKDTVMLTWGYGPKESFEDQIVPFADSGYDFFVCPGINNWSRILPNFGATTINIQNFVRDGFKHGASGMLNTAWEDDGEALQGYKWHGYAWGAECAWNASTTTPEDFNRRIGAVLFGEKGDHFGQAITLLAQTHRLPGMGGMNNRRFWQNDLQPKQSVAATRASAKRLLEIVQPAIEHLEACRDDATVNAHLLDAYLLGSRRMELIGLRMLDHLDAAELYAQAWEANDLDASARLDLLAQVGEIVSREREAHATLGREFERIWLAESKPYALDRVLERYARVDASHEALLADVLKAHKQCEAGKPLPPPEQLGLMLPRTYSRCTRPNKIVATPLDLNAPWAEPTATHRLGLVVAAGKVDREELPVELDVRLPEDLASKPVRAFCLIGDDNPREVLVQLDESDKPGTTRLVLLLPGPILKNTTATIHVYLGLTSPPEMLAESVHAAEVDDGFQSIKNNRVRLLLGAEGAHVYRWEVKDAANRDLTLPGTTGYAGFADAGRAGRGAVNRLTRTSHGPALVRYRCTNANGMTKTISLFGGTSWMEVVLSEPTTYYWDFDTPENFASDGPTPGTYLFSNGKTGPVGAEADDVAAQVKAAGVHWGIKFNDQQLALGIVTPEIAANHVIAPGASAGGVGIETSPPASHFITFAGKLELPAAETMNRLRRTLDFKSQPEVLLHALQEKQEQTNGVR